MPDTTNTQHSLQYTAALAKPRSNGLEHNGIAADDTYPIPVVGARPAGTENSEAEAG
jgi:hypothetical protein